VATGAPAETVTALFPRTAQIGARFGIVKVICGDLAVDVAAYRIDGPYSDCRRPDRVVFTGDLEKDLRRRDFTVNAMAYSPVRGFVDPFGGRRDLEAGIIRAVGDPGQRFREDALRILRGVRFSAQLGFVIEAATLSAMERLAPLLKNISAERVREELRGILLAPNAGAGIRLCRDIGILHYILGGAAAMLDGTEKKALEAFLAGIDGMEPDWHVRLGLLLICMNGIRAVAAIESLKLDNAAAGKLAAAVTLVPELDAVDDKAALKSCMSRHGREACAFAERLAGMALELGMPIFSGDAGARDRRKERLRWAEEIERDHEPVLLGELAVNGNDLIAAGFENGREIGSLLNRLLELVQHRPEYNEKELLLDKAAEYAKESNGREKRHDQGRHIL